MTGFLAATQPAAAQEPPALDALAAQGIRLVRIPGGEFTMGSNDGEPDQAPEHSVKVRGFFLAATEVTQAQWQAIMKNNPSQFPGCPDCPVEGISWTQATEYLTRLAALTKAAVRLPTEAEWEYAAGGGALHQPWSGTTDEAALGEHAWYAANAERKTHPVGTRAPNPLGIYDMSGNVWEWCADWHNDVFYRASGSDNPGGPPGGHAKILRGGSWINSSTGVRVTTRHRADPNLSDINLFGLRLALNDPAGGN